MYKGLFKAIIHPKAANLLKKKKTQQQQKKQPKTKQMLHNLAKMERIF